VKNVIIAVFFIISGTFVAAREISDASQISLLTGSSGPELYSTFGHSAIRIKDSVQNLDIVYNYGTFDFNVPNFYLKFIRGQLAYKLSIQRFESFVNGLKSENRSMIEQVLNLTIEQKKKLFYLLEENYKPENKYYKYDFFYDNCATRIRDIVKIAYGDDFSYHYSSEWEVGETTFRNLIDLYLGTLPWPDFGIDIALGLPTDAVARPTDYMFIPDNLSIGFDLATIAHDGEIVSFILSKKTILNRMDIEPKIFFITPGRLMWTLFVISLVLSFQSLKNGMNIWWYDVVYFSLIGIVGWIVFMLWFFTNHIATKDNLNLLWAVPFHFPVFLFWSKIPLHIRNLYVLIFGAIDILILVLWLIFPQNYHFAFIPLILIMLLRFVVIQKGIVKSII